MIITPASFEDEVEKIRDKKAEVRLQNLIELMVSTLDSLGYGAGVEKALDILIGQ